MKTFTHSFPEKDAAVLIKGLKNYSCNFSLKKSGIFKATDLGQTSMQLSMLGSKATIERTTEIAGGKFTV
jgi:hypothetical protein